MVSYYFVGFWKRVKDRIGLLGNNKPVYKLTENGISHEYMNFNNTEKLPFDTETYEDCQIFIGEYANPWKFDISEALEKYDEKQEITDTRDIHIIPSQKYKTYMQQSALQQMLSSDIINTKLIMWLLYGILAVNVVFGVLAVAGLMQG